MLMGETSVPGWVPPYRIIVGFEQEGSESGPKGSRKTRNHSSQHDPNPDTGPPESSSSCQNGQKVEKLREKGLLANSETG